MTTNTNTFSVLWGDYLVSEVSSMIDAYALAGSVIRDLADPGDVVTIERAGQVVLPWQA